MARRFTIQLLMDLATRIGANPTKLAGTRTNISFLGKGPDKNPLFQNRLAGLENATEANLGKPETLFAAIEDAVGWAKDGKLNSIQTEILGHNLSGINKILNPPVLPTASVTDIAPGIEGLRRFPKETHKFFGRPLKDKDFSEIDRMVMEGKIPDARGRKWNLKETGPQRYNRLTGTQEAGTSSKLDQLRRETAIKDLMKDKPPGYKLSEEQIRQYMIGRRTALKYDRETALRSSPWDKNLWGPQSRLPETGTGDLAAATARRTAQTGMSRAIARHILLQDTRIKLPPEILTSLRMSRDLAKGAEKYGPKYDPIEIMRRYYGRSMMNFDEWMDNILSRRVAGANAQELADLALKEIELLPQFAEGGLAEVLQAPRSGYSKGRLVRGALAILNRNKKNADYMFKASDNVSPGYAHGDIKYNAELLAEQLAEDAGVFFEDLGALEQTKFYGTAYDYLAAEMGKNLLRKRNLAKVTKALGVGEDLSGVSPAYGESYANQLLKNWGPGKGRKPSASGGLAGILEV